MVLPSDELIADLVFGQRADIDAKWLGIDRRGRAAPLQRNNRMKSSVIEHLASAGRLDRIYIGGEWVLPAGQERSAVIDPSTEEPLAEIALGNAQDVAVAVAAARRAFATWSVSAPQTRAALLDRIHALILERTEVFAQAISQEMGCAIIVARGAQVPNAVEHIRVARDLAASYPFVRHRGSTAIVREAIGVCGLITPWNWPLYQITAKVGPALAAGCTVVLKPSELSPLSALLFAEVVHDAGVPAGVFNLVNGSGPEVGAALATHPDVDMISITGSTRAGVLVAQAAAPTVKRVAQELGGKSPNVILPDADLARAIPAAVASGMRNVGQSCSAPTRMIVPRERIAEVERLAREAASALVVGDPRSPQTTHGPVANRAQFNRVQEMIAAGIAEGARLVCGGPGRPQGLDRGYYVRPTIFSDVQPQMRIAQEEIFGPVLVILAYDSVDEAVAIANGTDYGLGAHVQGQDIATARAVAMRIRSGQVHINNPPWSPDAPFGGYKRSGNGREYGVEGLEEYLETKAILGYGDGQALQ
jgi:aldehyde dehydrogenase (NAD+)